jgi:hypothetical protein
MERTANIQHSRFGSMSREAAGAEAAGNLVANIVVGALALIGSPVNRAMGALRSGLATWAEARRQRRADEQLWNLALSDARIMADLSRAMSQDAQRDGHAF